MILLSAEQYHRIRESSTIVPAAARPIFVMQVVDELHRCDQVSDAGVQAAIDEVSRRMHPDARDGWIDMPPEDTFA